MELKIQKILLLMSLILVTVGCSREPMIKLNEENQQAIEDKKKAKDEKLQESLSELSSDALGPDQNSVIDNGATASSESDQKETIAIDTSQWQIQTVPAYYEIQNFIPLKANEIRSFTNGNEIKTWYTLYQQPELGQMQVLSIEPKENKILLYRWTNGQLEEAKSEIVGQPFQELDLWNSSSNFSSVLQLPIAMGTSWDIGGVTASISQIYQEVILLDQTYNDVLEVTYGDQKYYYAKDIGLVANTGPEGNWVISERTENVMLVTPLEIMIPDETKTTLLKKEPVKFSWQTNDRFEVALTRILQEQGLISKEILVNSVQVDNGLTIVDFSFGVVANLNAHLQGEQAAVAAIIATLAQLTGQERVILTVGGYGLAPETYPYPENGIYQYHPQWLTEYFESPFSMTQATPEATAEEDMSTIELTTNE